jgi:hypothetical protein
MTVFGKVLVFCNLVLSLLLMTWALGVWTNRIDFSDTQAKGDQVAGEFNKRKAVLDSLWADVRPAQGNWRSARKAVADQEAFQVAAWEWYHGEIAHNIAGDKAKPNDPCRMVVYADKADPATGRGKGLIAVDPRTGLPVMAPAKDRNGKDLVFPLDTLNQQLEDILKNLAEVQDRHKKQIDEAKALTDKLIGDKGLHQRLVDEKQKRADVVAEQKLITPLLINTYVESDLIGKRHQQLVLRKEELKKVGVAVRDR